MAPHCLFSSSTYSLPFPWPLPPTLSYTLPRPILSHPILCPPESVCGHTVSSRRGSWRSLRSSIVTLQQRIWETSGRLVAGRMAPSTRWSTSPRARSWLSRWPADRHTSPEFYSSRTTMNLPLPCLSCCSFIQILEFLLYFCSWEEAAQQINDGSFEKICTISNL